MNKLTIVNILGKSYNSGTTSIKISILVENRSGAYTKLDAGLEKLPLCLLNVFAEFFGITKYILQMFSLELQPVKFCNCLIM